MTTNARLNELANRLMKRARKSARTKQFECTITIDWVRQRLVSGVCEATGLPLEFNHRRGDNGYYRSPWGPSIDKTNATYGYTPDNARIICNIYNMTKGEGTDDQILEIARTLVGRADHAI
jgi:hypothetical protein